MAESTEWEYQEEPIIGHGIAAREKEKSDLSKQLDRACEKYDMERAFDSPRIEIKVGDVDWDETKSLTLRLETLESIVNQFGNRRKREEIDDKIEELIRYDDYSFGPRGDNLKYKHQGWIDALRWVCGRNIGEEP